jgi:hypothetical protein
MPWFDAFTTQEIKDYVHIVCARPDEPSPFPGQLMQSLPQLGIVAPLGLIAAAPTVRETA